MRIIYFETAGALKEHVTFGTGNNLYASYLLSLSGYIVLLERTIKKVKETPSLPEKIN